jgi:hypothetical protein
VALSGRGIICDREDWRIFVDRGVCHTYFMLHRKYFSTGPCSPAAVAELTFDKLRKPNFSSQAPAFFIKAMPWPASS